MAFETIVVERPEPRIARIVMNRPEARNAQNLQMTYDLNAAFDQAVLKLDSLIDYSKDRSNLAATGAESAYWRALKLMVGAIVLAALWALAGTVWTSRNVSQPIVRVSEIMRRLAKGEHSLVIGNDGRRKDEIGVLIDAAVGYQESLLRGRHLAEQRQESGQPSPGTSRSVCRPPRRPNV